MNITQANTIFRQSIIRGFFEPELLKLDFAKSHVRHPLINSDGLMRSPLLHIFFDVETGSDYPDGDEWFIIDLLFPYMVQLPDSLKGTDFFTTIHNNEETFWHHRELVRYKYGKSKKLDDSLEFIESKYSLLYKLIEPLGKDLM